MKRWLREGGTMALALCVGGAIACGGGGSGGGGKGAEAPGNPSGSSASDESQAASSAPSSKDEDGPAPAAKSPATKVGPAPGEEPPPSSGTPYDKDAVEIELKRAARQVRANCGSATDEEGNASGPWGKTTASVTLGRNGHVKVVTLPAPYDGKPVALCAAHAFQKIQFPPYAAPDDVVVEREIDLVKPKH